MDESELDIKVRLALHIGKLDFTESLNKRMQEGNGWIGIREMCLSRQERDVML